MNREEYFDRATELYECKKYGEAIELLVRANTKYPDDTDILLLLAGCYVQITRFIDAVKVLLLANKIEPNEPTILYNLGYALLCGGRINDAYKYFDECLKLNSPKEVRKMAQGMIKNRVEFEKMLDKSESISLQEEFDVYDFFLEAQKYLYSGKYEKAIFIYNKILEKVPKHYQSIQNIGTAYMMQNMLEKAISYFEKSIALHPSDDMCLANLAHAYHKIGNVEKSEFYIKELEKNIDKPILRDLIRILVILIEIKQFDFARKLINDSEHNNIQVDFLSGILYALQKDYQNAKSIFLKLKGVSDLASEYYNADCSLEEGKIKEYAFESRNIIDSSVEVL